MQATALLCSAMLAFSVHATAAAETGAGSTDQADAAVRAAAAGLDAAWNAGDAAAFAGRWTEDGVVVSPTGESTQGRGQIQADVTAQFAGPLKGTTHRLDIERVYDVQSGAAVADGEAVVQALNGQQWKAHFSAVFERNEVGVWLVRHMTSYVFISR